MAIKRGVSFYSYQQAQYVGEMTYEDMFRELRENLHCDGVEIINEAIVAGYPFPSKEWLATWHSNLARYDLNPVCLDGFLDTMRLRTHAMNEAEAGELVKVDLQLAHDMGFKHIRTMTGLPTETDEDLLGIAELAKVAAGAYYSVPKDKRVKGLRITCSASVFVPKPFTPFQWCAQDRPEDVVRKQHMVKDAFQKYKNARFIYHDSSLSRIEACFAVGDRRLSKVLYRAWQSGCILDGWDDHLFH